MAATHPTTTTGVTITGPSACSIVERRAPAARDDFVLIKVHAAAMCNEHNAYRDGTYIWGETPDRLGHEIAGEVIDAGRSNRVRVGDRVVANMPFFSCGRCGHCRRGSLAYCEDAHQVDHLLPSTADVAGFAQYTLRGDWALIPIPDDLSYRHAACALCGCGPAHAALEAMGVSCHATVLVTGLGPVGLGCVMMARARGARVIGVGRQPYRRALAQRLGAEAVIDPDDGDPREAIRTLTRGRGVQAAIECSAQPTYLRLAIDATAVQGAITALGECGPIELNVLDDLIRHGRTLHGRLDITNAEIARVLELFERMPNELDTYLTHSFALRDIEQAWRLQETRACGKLLIDPWA